MASDALPARDGVWSEGGPSGRGPSARHLRVLPPPQAYGVAPAWRRRASCLPPAPAVVRSVSRPRVGSPAPLRLTARGRCVVAVLLLLVATGTAAGAGALLGDGAEGLELMGTSSVIVQPGDTLWSIASGVAGERDVREVIDGIQLLNGLESASIEPGQVLELP